MYLQDRYLYIQNEGGLKKFRSIKAMRHITNLLKGIFLVHSDETVYYHQAVCTVTMM